MAYRGMRGVPQDDDSGYLERHNDNMVGDLASKVSALKNISISIGNDVREQNRLLNEMDSDFDSGKSLLGATMKKLGIVARAGGSRLQCYLILFALFVFFIIYSLMR
ncbi:hypothetical protein PFISCL1PPCAC_15130 [Pristionchus fissidentatus]|uniref:t-SNARE coiled-coil homology domain-containing protein n=1 Tax=Pristionchus fissidentatus TaxID=1538716 RepID=A0AAV5W035_9BILA|nr:hypothetical protein PFISCL1PPCAC_15130 [Pristionchus fissidentatus]